MSNLEALDILPSSNRIIQEHLRRERNERAYPLSLRRSLWLREDGGRDFIRNINLRYFCDLQTSTGRTNSQVYDEFSNGDFCVLF